MGILRRLFTRDGYRQEQAEPKVLKHDRVSLTEDEQRARDLSDKDFDERAAGRSD